jgi:NAD(P)-dependent dehydrogenase (short-subunit alcohol dehydrogenase family)
VGDAEGGVRTQRHRECTFRRGLALECLGQVGVVAAHLARGHRGQERLLAGEVLVRGVVGHAGTAANLAQRDGRLTALIQELLRCVDERVARVARAHVAVDAVDAVNRSAKVDAVNLVRSSSMRAVITGSTNGIGAVIAERLAREGADVTLVGRSDERLRATAEAIRAAAPGAEVATERADLADLDQVRALTNRLAAASPFDVVISNAALVAPLDERGPLGIPRTVVVNYLAPYVLLRGLAEAQWDHPARFVIVGADPEYLAASPIDPEDLRFDDPERLGDDPRLRPFALYAHTKNMDAMLMYGLARRLRDTAITVNGAHPGIIGQTGLTGETPGLTEAVHIAYGLDETTFPSPEVGADTPAWLATAPELAGVTGRYFVDRKAVPTGDHTTDEARVDRLWDRTAQILGLPAALTRSGRAAAA